MISKGSCETVRYQMKRVLMLPYQNRGSPFSPFFYDDNYNMLRTLQVVGDNPNEEFP